MSTTVTVPNTLTVPTTPTVSAALTRHAGHLEIQWLVATACLCFEQAERWGKRAEARGFRFVAIPIQPQGHDVPNHDPFAIHVGIPSSPSSIHSVALTFRCML